MRTTVRLQLDAADRISAFCRDHPDEHPAFATAVGNLNNLLGRAEGLLQQQVRGMMDEGAASENKQAVRRAIRRELGDLLRFADAASLRQPESAVRLHMPGATTSDRGFITAGRVMIGAAEEHRDILQTYGMPDNLLQTIGEALDRYEGIVAQKATSVSTHVGASADLVAVNKLVTKEVRRIDALYRRKFRDNPELLASWKSVRSLHAKARSAKAEQGPPTASAA